MLAFAAGFVFLTAAGAAHGGYFPGSWGWLTLAAAWAATMALVLDEEAGVSRAGLAFLGLLTAFALWTLCSALWSVDVTSTMLEAQRNLVYVAAVLAALAIGRSRPAALLGAVWASAGALCAYALATRLVPDRFGVFNQISGYRLSEPVGYWNSLGMLAAIGLLVALGFAARGGTLWVRALAAGSVPLFATTIYFTFSRGAWASLFAGLVVLIALDPRRLQVLWWIALGAIGSGVAVALSVREHALATVGAPLAQQAHDGHRLVIALLVVAAATAGVAARWDGLTPNLQRFERHAKPALAAVVVVAVVAFFAVAGAPWTVASDAWHGFSSAPPASSSSTLNNRLFHLSGSGRVAQWRIAWHELEHHALAGSGGGTYERFWNQTRESSGKIRNVHNLYLEAGATLGVIGAALLLLALSVPIAAGAKARRLPFAPFALAAFVAYLVHGIVDWDWQLTGVTMPALLCAVVLVDGPALRLPRAPLTGVAIALAVVGLFGIALQTTLTRIDKATSVSAATHDAHQAADVQPWSTEPWRRLGEYDLAHHDYPAARAAFRHALRKDDRDWSLWFDLARSSSGPALTNALERASALNPHSPEIASYRATLASFSKLNAAK